MTALEIGAYELSDYVADLRAITAKSASDEEIINQVRPLAQRLASDKGWLKPEHYEAGEEQGIGVHLLHEEPDHTLAVFAMSWLPHRGAPPHDHATWAVVSGVDGTETNTFWKRVDDGTREGYAEIVKAGEKEFGDGEVLSLLPDAIHSVENRTDKVTVSLHTYGVHINFSGRSTFDPEQNAMKPFIVEVE